MLDKFTRLLDFLNWFIMHCRQDIPKNTVSHLQKKMNEALEKKPCYRRNGIVLRREAVEVALRKQLLILAELTQ